MKKNQAEKIKTYSPTGFREKFLGEDNPMHLLFKSDSDHFFCLEIEEIMQMQHPVPPSKHSCHTLIFISSGQHIMKLGYQEYTTIDNEIIMVPAGQIFSLDNVNNIHKGYICQFHPDILIRKYGSRELLNEFDFLKISGDPKITLPPEDIGAVINILERLKKEYSETAFTDLNIVQSYLITLFYEMNKNAVKTKKGISAAEVITAKFKELIHDHVKSQHQVNYYSSLLSVTPNHLNKCVKTVTGKSAVKWIDENILLEAKYLLFQTTLSVGEIAIQVGFEDQSYFSRFFKKAEGISPIRYRKMIDKS